MNAKASGVSTSFCRQIGWAVRVMPKRIGYDILRALRMDDRTKTPRVVLDSSKNQESDRAWGKRQGADDYLGKPFTSDQLLTMVKRFAR